ncbi:hypothetical protein NliqN6_5307 [Naganishia liquefaciens]|uniref:SPIN90/Ldb17 leucine-rich domain-containing protein n=1 Tax=Naganishia liquefaciens TaxID=104408 RepID=A0A8H3TXZ7_9TREE|nr:hypothetical protein NliqN6_5307 [Naganishia liquefaciens]
MDLEILNHQIEDRDRFWDELDNLLDIPASPKLSDLDNTLMLYIAIVSRYHDLYMQTAREHQQVLAMLVKSDLFRYYSERMIGLVMTGAEESTNPHTLYILYNILLFYGHKHHSLFRSHRKWRKLLASLCDTIIVECEDAYTGTGLLQPIEARLRLPAAMLMYEVCRVQKLTSAELDGFDDLFIDRLFEMIEVTRDTDEILNYAIIRLIVALNEQFMVSSVHSGPSSHPVIMATSPVAASPIANLRPDGQPRNHYRAHSNSHPPLTGPISTYSSAAIAGHRETVDKEAKEKEEQSKRNNRVLSVLMRRLGHSKTFGENIIFMLNRSQDNAEDLCVQLLILKILYLLFTTPGTQEYFFTNDLRVLVDVFIRELVDLPDESEALRHTYLRVLHPLLTNTQLRKSPYKHAQIRLVLLSLISNSHIKDINPTTKRLVERCLNADWGIPADATTNNIGRKGSVADSGVSIRVADENGTPILQRKESVNRTLGRSQSAEDMPKLHKVHAQRLQIDTNHPNLSLTDVAGAAPPPTRKHARSVTSDAAPEDHGKKRLVRSSALSPVSAESIDSSYDPSESGVSDGESSASAVTEQGRKSGPSADKTSACELGHSPLGRWMQFTSPEPGSKPEHGLFSQEEQGLARQVGIYEADSIIGARDQRVNARFNEVHPAASSNVASPTASIHKRKPPAVPSRAHKPSNLSNPDLTYRNTVTINPGKTPWSPPFLTHKDLGHEADDDTSLNSDILGSDNKENGKSLGFAALAQALRETGNKIGIGHHHHGSSRKDSMKKRRPRTEAAEVLEPEPGSERELKLDIDAPVVVRKWDSGDQSSGWTTFA